ncbi:hypothetical protein Arub01_10420 [Actinomadura rubrobrunea]|uniref:Solute-binding protein family 5 domain-containing protein n=1 Tax=Actinomadura rubrobrunea TaxID=115335 RepID=A0A9W6PTQ2_9ACTN|nr:ABC transporter family substrate-binding protein [Actinomadura rubrobrunea]GLW62798.1 hypothetical protein Arub01_10420 [Actinomadura rubrobrunea]
MTRLLPARPPRRPIPRAACAMRAVRIGVLAALLAWTCGCDRPVAEPRRMDARKLPASDVNLTPRALVRDGGTLRWPVPEFPTQWNFYHVNGTKSVVSDVVQGLLPHVMRVDEKAVPRPVPEYVESAKVTWEGSEQVVTYRINPKARWSDGRPITYRDFAAQARALSGHDRRYQAAVTTGYRYIRRVERGSDDREAVVRFAKPFADWKALFSPLYPASTMADPEAFGAAWQGRMGPTAGPFRVAKIDRTAKTVTVVRDPKWWGRPAKLDRIVYRAMDAAAMPGAFANGEIDLMDINVDAGALRRAADVPNADIRRAGGPDWRQFTLNAASPLLADVRVRRAVLLGIDRDALARAALGELGWPAQTLGNHFFMNTQEGYQDNSGELGRYDPAAAERLLDEAGWRRQGKYRVKDGRTLALRFVVPAGMPGSRQEGELTRAMLARIGIRVDVWPVPVDDLFDQYVTPGNFDIVPFSWLGTAFPMSALRSVFSTPKGDRIQQNYARLGTPDIDALLDKAAHEVDQDRARRLINEADRLIWRLATVLPLYQRPQIVAIRSDLANFGALGFYEPPYEDIGFTGRGDGP